MPGQTTSPIRLLVANDHPLVLAGIGAIVSEQSHMTLVGEAGDGIEAVALFKAHRPDLTLTDLQMPRKNGLATERRPPTRFFTT